MRCGRGFVLHGLRILNVKPQKPAVIVLFHNGSKVENFLIKAAEHKAKTCKKLMASKGGTNDPIGRILSYCTLRRTANHTSCVILRLYRQFEFCGIFFAVVIVFGKFAKFFCVMSDSGSSNSELEVTDTVNSRQVKIKRWKTEKVENISLRLINFKRKQLSAFLLEQSIWAHSSRNKTFRGAGRVSNNSARGLRRCGF